MDTGLTRAQVEITKDLMADMERLRLERDEAKAHAHAAAASLNRERAQTERLQAALHKYETDNLPILRSQVLRFRDALERMMIGGNHLATYRSDAWPDYKLDGLTRRQHAEHGLRMLGAGRDYDMWCCWSAIMQARDEVADLLVLYDATPTNEQNGGVDAGP